ncbi:caspase family protein [Flectobacillus roseus]
MYKRLQICVLLVLLIPTFTLASDLRLIIMADVQAADIGFSTMKDINTMEFEFETIAKELNLNFKKTILTYDQFTRASLFKQISDLPVTDTDVLVFYYSGHGFALQNTKSIFPNLKVKDVNNLNLTDVHEQLKKKKARLCMSFADCCNNTVSEAVLSRTPVRKGISNQSDILRKLFLESKGDIILASSRREEQALGDENGGIYTRSWLESLTFAKAQNLTIEWQSLLDDAEVRLQNKLTQIEGSKHIQHSIFEINVTVYDPVIVKVDPVIKDSVIVEPTPPKPLPSVSFSEMNKYLNTLVDERISLQKRWQILDLNRNKFFPPVAQVKEYINLIENKLEPVDIDIFLASLVSRAQAIKEINVVENLSTFSDQGKYQIITIQEIR